MPYIYPVTEIISEKHQPVKAYHHSPTPPHPSKPSASHQKHHYYVNEINEAVNEDTDDGYRRRQAQTGFLQSNHDIRTYKTVCSNVKNEKSLNMGSECFLYYAVKLTDQSLLG